MLGTKGFEFVRALDSGLQFRIPSHLIRDLRSVGWEALLPKGIFLLSYGVGLYMTYRAFQRYILNKSAELEASRSFTTQLWTLLREWDPLHSAVPVEFENDPVDDDGVIMHRTRTGSTVYFRQLGHVVPDSLGNGWEWSLDCDKWFPTWDLKRLERLNDCNDDCSCFPSKADKTLILRMEVERRLRLRASGKGSWSPSRSSGICSAASQPPPLDPPSSSSSLADIPAEFLCPITLKLMLEPVVTPSGITYNRAGIIHWISNNHTDPATGEDLEADWLIPNLTLRNIIQKWLVDDESKIRKTGATQQRSSSRL